MDKRIDDLKILSTDNESIKLVPVSSENKSSKLNLNQLIEKKINEQTKIITLDSEEDFAKLESKESNALYFIKQSSGLYITSKELSEAIIDFVQQDDFDSSLNEIRGDISSNNTSITNILNEIQSIKESIKIYSIQLAVDENFNFVGVGPSFKSEGDLILFLMTNLLEICSNPSRVKIEFVVKKNNGNFDDDFDSGMQLNSETYICVPSAIVLNTRDFDNYAVTFDVLVKNELVTIMIKLNSYEISISRKNQFWVGTVEEYDSTTKDDKTFYFIKEEVE